MIVFSTPSNYKSSVLCENSPESQFIRLSDWLVAGPAHFEHSLAGRADMRHTHVSRTMLFKNGGALKFYISGSSARRVVFGQ